MSEALPIVEEREGTFYIQGQRVRLASLVYDWNHGASPETIADNFTVLRLAEVYGAIAFYLNHQADLDRHFAELAERERQLESEYLNTLDEHGRELRQRFEAMRQHREVSAP